MRDEIRRRVAVKMELFVHTFFASTTEMSGPEAALYLLTLAWAWDHEASLPANVDRLRKALRYEKDEWSRSWPEVAKKWKRDGERLRNPKLSLMMRNATERVAFSILSGQKGAATRWGKTNEIKGQNSPPIDPAMATPPKPPIAYLDLDIERSSLNSSSVPISEETARPKTSMAKATVLGSFEDFWKEYPRRVGKRKALAVWKKLKGPERLLALHMVVAFAGVWKLAPPNRRRFIPHPATWLGQGRFEDDVAEWSRQAASDERPETATALVGSHGGVDLAGAPGSPERAAALLAAKGKR